MSVAIDQALVTAFIGGNFGLPIAHENITYDPTPGAAYAELIVMQNDTTPASMKHSNETDGVFRVILRYPTDGGAIAAKTMADTIFAIFKIGARLTYSGVVVNVNGNSRYPGVSEDGWYKMILTMPYRALLTR